MKRALIVLLLSCACISAQIPIGGSSSAGGGTNAFKFDFTATTTTGAINASSHGQGLNASMFCYDNATPAKLLNKTDDGYAVTNAADGTITGTWTGTKTGYCVIFSGARGAAGPAGAPGSQGATGQQGPAGPTGATGATGPTGPTGPQGPTGSAGSGTVSGSGSPVGVTGCSAAGTIYTDTGTGSTYTCTATGTPGTWQLTSGSGTTVPLITGTTPGSVLTWGTGGVSFGSTNCTFGTSPTITITAASGSDTTRMWVDSACHRIFNYNPAIITGITLGSGITADTTSSAFPVDVQAVATAPTSGTNFTSLTSIPYQKVNTWSSTGCAAVGDTSTGHSITSTTCFDTQGSNTVAAGTQDFSGAAHTLPSKKGTAAGKPATCTQGEEYFATDATAGQNKYYCTAPNTWTQQSGGTSTVTENIQQTYGTCNASTGTLTNMRSLSSATVTCNSGAPNWDNEALVVLASSQFYFISTELPATWTGPVTLDLIWVTGVLAGTAGDKVRFVFESKCIATGATIDVASYNTAVNVDSSAATVARGRGVASLTVDTTGCSAGNTLIIQLSKGTASQNYAGTTGMLRGVWHVQHN